MKCPEFEVDTVWLFWGYDGDLKSPKFCIITDQDYFYEYSGPYGCYDNDEGEWQNKDGERLILSCAQEEFKKGHLIYIGKL